MSTPPPSVGEDGVLGFSLGTQDTWSSLPADELDMVGTLSDDDFINDGDVSDISEDVPCSYPCPACENEPNARACEGCRSYWAMTKNQDSCPDDIEELPFTDSEPEDAGVRRLRREPDASPLCADPTQDSMDPCDALSMEADLLCDEALEDDVVFANAVHRRKKRYVRVDSKAHGGGDE